MKEKELTAYRVSKDTGISQASLADWRKGRSKPKIDKLQKWKKAKGSKVRSDCNERTIEFQKRCRKLG